MYTIKFSKKYKDILQSAMPTINYISTTDLLTGIEEKTFGIIPPLNTNITFSMLPKYDKRAHVYSVFPLQEEWNWREVFSSDTEAIKNKKKLITKPGNQGNCGSCWAISAAGIVNDNFIALGKVDYNPDISTTYSLACYPQSQCNGGNPAQLFTNSAKTGLASNHCIDYSWCFDDSFCSQQNMKITKSMDQLNKLIPNCGCYYPENHIKYFVKNVSWANIDNDKNVQETIKSHIYTYGAVMGGFHVYENFQNSQMGNFSKSGGVYLECVDYSNNQNYFLPPNQYPSPLDTSLNWAGSHAVAVIGWGIQKKVKTKDLDHNEVIQDIPYWYCRNSWTTNWGEGGFFKIAMYPYNQVSQFEKPIMVSTSEGSSSTGGFVTMQADKAIKGNLNSVSSSFENQKKLKDDMYYKTEPSENPIVEPIKNKKNYLYIFLFIFIILILLSYLLIF